MKLTRSLAAKAIARAKVPIRTIGLRMLTLSSCRTSSTTTEAAKINSSRVKTWLSIQATVARGMKEAPLAPLTTMK